MAKMYLSVCKQTIAQNRNKPRSRQTPPMRVSRGKYGRPKRYWSIILSGPVTVMYDNENPMPWGAKVWLEWEVV